jgi:hypothetical protein
MTISLAHEVDVQVRPAADDLAVLKNQACDSGLENLQIRLQLQSVLQAELIGFLVALGSRRLHGRTLGLVEQSKLNAGEIGIDSHLAAQSVNFPNHLPLGLAADRRIAAHLGNRIDVAGEEQGGGSHPRRSQGGLHSGVAGPTDDNIERFLVINHGKSGEHQNKYFDVILFPDAKRRKQAIENRLVVDFA